MRIDQILATSEEPVFSFEFFPPRTEEGERTLRFRSPLACIRRLSAFSRQE